MTPTTHSLDAERQAFEAWCKANHPHAPLYRRPNNRDEYDAALAAWTWEAWKARAELTRPLEVAAPVGDAVRVKFEDNFLVEWSAPIPDGEYQLAASRPQEVVRAEPVAVIGDTFSLFWVGSKPIAELARKHNLKVGDKLYTAPPSTAPAQTQDHLANAESYVQGGEPADATLIASFLKHTEIFHQSDTPDWLYARDGDGCSTSIRTSEITGAIRNIIKELS